MTPPASERVRYSSTFIFEIEELDDEFHRLNDEIAQRARRLPGFLGEESWHDEGSGLHAEVYYWSDMESLQRLVGMDVHGTAKRRHDLWLGEYRVVISEVQSVYGNPVLGLTHVPPDRGPAAPASRSAQAGDAQAMLTGLSAFPLTPLVDDAVDERAFAGLIERLAVSGVDSITALGSTGSGAYLSGEERRRVARLAVEHAGSTPVVVGVGALRTSQVLGHVRSAEDAGASGVLLAPMAYQPLTEDDVFALFRTVTEQTALPVVVYDNPGTTHFAFTTELYGRIAHLPGIASIKIPGVPADPERARARVQEIRAVVPEHVTIGVSGDALAATGLNAGCDAWYSVVAGTLPEPALRITRAAQRGQAREARAASERLAPLWRLFADLGGSYRVVAAIAEQLGLVPPRSLPLPIQGLDEEQRARVARVVAELELDAG